jgi:signal transduction histidine kinase
MSPRAIRGGTLAFALAALTAISSVDAVSPAAGRVTELDVARIVPGDARPTNTAVGRVVSLPHAWSQTHPDLAGDAWYMFVHRLDPLPGTPQALYLTGTTLQAEVWVNGEFVGATGPLDGRRPRSYERSQRFTIPGDTLRPGDNDILVHVRAPRAALARFAPVRIGDAASLRVEAVTDLVVHTLAPAAVTTVNVTVGFFLLALWMRRREPSHVALLAVAAILWGVHTGVTLLPEPPIPDPHYGIWWHGVYMLFVVLLCLFCVRFAQRRWPVYERIAVAFAFAVVPLLYLAQWLGVADAAASAIRLTGIALVVWALWGVAGFVRAHPGTESRLLLLAGLVSAAFAAHDWIVSLDPSSVRPVWLVPYAALAFLLLVGWIVVDRFVRALNATERTNLDLEARVAEKGAALAAQLAETRAAKEAAEAANAAKSRFLAAASHDLRQPLHAIGLFAHALGEHARGPEERSLVQRISRSVDSLDALFSSLLDVSRLDAGAVAVQIEDLPANALLDRIAADFAPEAVERDLVLTVVPSTMYLRTDAMLIERILRNLVANALRYTQRGGVVVGCRRRHADVSLEVWDTGPGIDPADRARIFDEFYRGAGGEDGRRGLGLGLSIVRRLVDLLGHTIEVDSRPGRGSVFRVILPRGDGSRAAPPASIRPDAPALAGRRIVVIDDEPPICEGMRRLLAAWGCRPIVATHIDAAVDTLRGAPPPDALVVDYALAGDRDGLDAIAAIRDAVGADVPAVLVSGESHPDELARIRDSGLMVIHKPVPPARLRSTLAHLLQAAAQTPS